MGRPLIHWRSLGTAWGLCWEFFLAPQASNLTFEEVVDRVLTENQYKMESLLDHVRKLWAWLRGELDDLTQAHEHESEKSARKKMKKDMEQRQKDLKGLEATISKYESMLGGVPEDDPSDSEDEDAMAITPVANDAPVMSTSPESLTSPPEKEQTLPWRWMTGMIVSLQLVLSPIGRMSS